MSARNTVQYYRLPNGGYMIAEEHTWTAEDEAEAIAIAALPRATANPIYLSTIGTEE
ncbi:hypothetical protein [Kitasatospora sp. NPDC005856]|uniref:hypothetical protein n=1 Tax=Kitasatospora sp. NPDC005856 TaxID=3154566 RepID=UPI0034039F76